MADGTGSGLDADDGWAEFKDSSIKSDSVVGVGSLFTLVMLALNNVEEI